MFYRAALAAIACVLTVAQIPESLAAKLYGADMLGLAELTANTENLLSAILESPKALVFGLKPEV